MSVSYAYIYCPWGEGREWHFPKQIRVVQTSVENDLALAVELLRVRLTQMGSWIALASLLLWLALASMAARWGVLLSQVKVESVECAVNSDWLLHPLMVPASWQSTVVSIVFGFADGASEFMTFFMLTYSSYLKLSYIFSKI